jgi:soluble lytic murein transglycosylase
VKQHGDPRDPNVDPVDWVERIPISETRNYVQRVMENLQVYRARFGTEAPVTANADQQQAGTRKEANSVPAATSQASDPE